eukprot:symbB.v1.2.023557.t2/scaffold2163.1/size87302/1
MQPLKRLRVAPASLESRGMADVELPESLKCDSNFKLEIKRLSKEWRLKRESFRSTAPLVEPEEQLVSAAAAGDLPKCRELLERRAARADACAAGHTALLAAAAAGKADSVIFLLDARATPSLGSSTGVTALHLAAEAAHGKICLALLSARADPCYEDHLGRTPAALASIHEALWPLFSAAGCERVTPRNLSTHLTSPDPTVCSTRPSSATSAQRGSRTSLPIDILGDESHVVSSVSSLHSLGAAKWWMECSSRVGKVKVLMG